MILHLLLSEIKLIYKNVDLYNKNKNILMKSHRISYLDFMKFLEKLVKGGQPPSLPRTVKLKFANGLSGTPP